MEKIVSSLENFLESILLSLPRYALGLVVLLGGIYIVKLILRIIGKRFDRRDLDKSLKGFLLSMIRIALYIVLLVIVASIMGFKSMSLTAVFASTGLAIGLALQGSLSNFAGGVLILLFKPFKIGDYISNTGGVEGTVDKIDLLYTTVTGATGLKIYCPNGPLANSVITNYTDITARRYDFVVGISYDTNIKTAQNVIQEALAKHKEVKQDPKPIIFVNSLADSSVNLNVRVWMDKANYWDTVFVIQQIVKNALDNANIEIPFPQRDIHVISDKEIK
ncbi:mechanosensitive ion channel family protein [Myroides odoratimimus]|uniref:mechanosensitive ion channel family protein n=1 Tax=Myroides odoratimimus TaxID=76832 RepID=UPI002DB86631|nr:mechanosensitive ion channel family protein [Myroides odoratimimus]MEC4051479.1 mechanosensitive ion channel family protein [Myroides odoratimimus]